MNKLNDLGNLVLSIDKCSVFVSDNDEYNQAWIKARTTYWNRLLDGTYEYVTLHEVLRDLGYCDIRPIFGMYGWPKGTTIEVEILPQRVFVKNLTYFFSIIMEE